MMICPRCGKLLKEKNCEQCGLDVLNEPFVWIGENTESLIRIIKKEIYDSKKMHKSKMLRQKEMLQNDQFNLIELEAKNHYQKILDETNDDINRLLNDKEDAGFMIFYFDLERTGVIDNILYLANKGNTDAMLAMARINNLAVNRRGADTDIDWLIKAAEQSDDRAINRLAVYYANCSEDLSSHYKNEPDSWLRKRAIEKCTIGDKVYKGLENAANQGNSNAMYVIACQMYYGIDQRRKNEEEGMEWFKRAAENGHSYAVDWLVWHYFHEAQKYASNIPFMTKRKPYNDCLKEALKWCKKDPSMQRYTMSSIEKLLK